MIGFRNRPRTDFIVLHCSQTHPDELDTLGRRFDALSLDRKHRELGALCCGYHHVILRDGACVSIRPQTVPGNHCPGVNSVSVAVCLIGGKDREGNPEQNFTEDQWETLKFLLDALTRQYPDARVVGHQDVASHKTTCPSFDVLNWISVQKTRRLQKQTKEQDHEQHKQEPEPWGPYPAAPSVEG